MEVNRFDKDAMAMFGLDPCNEKDIAEWLTTEPPTEASETSDYSRDHYEFGSPQSGQYN